MLHGVDASSNQGIIMPRQWELLFQRGTRFAVAKCGNGNDGSDTEFDRNISSARDAGMVVGAYHFVYAGLPNAAGHVGRDPVLQARAHWAASKGLGSAAGTLPPCADAEWPAPQDWAKWGVTAASIRVWLLAYLTELERLAGVTPMLYTYPDWAKNVSFGSEFIRFPLWAAEYDVFQGIKPWAGYSILQTAGGKPSSLSRRFEQPTVLPDGLPIDTDVADEAMFERLLQRAA